MFLLELHILSSFSTTQFIYSSIQTKASFQVTQYQIKNWSNDRAVRNIHTILTVIQDVVKLRQSTSDGPVVVHCRYNTEISLQLHSLLATIHNSDTVGCSGVFCAASNAIEQCQLEGRVSIFQAVKRVRMLKPGAVSTVVRTAISMHCYYVECDKCLVIRIMLCNCRTIAFLVQFCACVTERPPQ